MAKPKSDLRLEIAHFLFIDIAGYSIRDGICFAIIRALSPSSNALVSSGPPAL
jgi:hypothetical protein